jgi:triphosphoribosyl-dephospho-CoA synthetase
MNRDIQSKIDDTDNVKAKQKLLELQEEINEKLASGEEMSKYDLEYLQKKYDLEVAKIALEEAQNAKSKVRLSRDSEGNFGYVYTAD